MIRQHIIIGFSLILFISLLSCQENKTNDSILSDDTESDSLEILCKMNQSFKFHKGNKFNYLISSNNTTVYFNCLNSSISGIEKEIETGFKEIYKFDDSENLEYLSRYYTEDDNRSSSEFIAYKNGLVDENNSTYVRLERKKISADFVEIELNYEGGYKFLSGKVFIGKKMFFLKDSSDCKFISLTRNPQTLKIPKNYIIDNKVCMSIYIQRALGRDIKYIQTNPGEGAKSFSQLYVKEVNLRD